MTSSFAPATRAASKARVALCGPSGSGKTYTSLAIAHGLGSQIAVVDTERGSASKYAGVNGWAFETTVPDSFSPDSLSGLLAEASGLYDVVVVDSLSHYWMGVDGMLEQADRLKTGGNSFSGWKEARPAERRMIDALVSFPGHLIVTMRTKTEYVVEENDRGKKVPRKVGLKPEQRDGIEYEFDLVGDLDLDNKLVVSKSRIPVLSRQVIPEPGLELAAQLHDWLSEGTERPDANQIRTLVMAETNLEELVAHGNRAHELGISKAAVVDGSGRPMTLMDFIRMRWQEVNTLAKAADTPQGGGEQ